MLGVTTYSHVTITRVQQMTIHEGMLHCLNTVLQMDSHSILLCTFASQSNFQADLDKTSLLKHKRHQV